MLTEIQELKAKLELAQRKIRNVYMSSKEYSNYLKEIRFLYNRIAELEIKQQIRQDKNEEKVRARTIRRIKKEAHEKLLKEHAERKANRLAKHEALMKKENSFISKLLNKINKFYYTRITRRAQ